MLPLTDQSIHSTLVTLMTIVLLGGTLAFLVSRLAGSRPGFTIGGPVAFAFAIRVVAAGLISLTPVAQTLRGGDEVTFLTHATRVAGTPFGSTDWTHVLLTELHVFVLAVQDYAFDSPELVTKRSAVWLSRRGLRTRTPPFDPCLLTDSRTMRRHRPYRPHLRPESDSLRWLGLYAVA